MRPAFIKSFKRIKYMEKKKELEPVDYKFTAAAGPSHPVGVQVGYIPPDSSSATQFQNGMFIKITYYCRLFDRVSSTIAE